MIDEWAKVLILPFVYVAAGALAICLCWFSRSRLRQLLITLGIKNLKVAGVEISMSSSELDRAQKKVDGLNPNMKESSELSELAEVATPYIVGSRLLWVDDNPLGNIEERRAFRLLGIEVKNCRNTSSAIEHLCLDCWRRPKTEPLLRVVPTQN